MIQGHFYFIQDEYFEKYDPQKRIPANKGDSHNRPYFFAFHDPQNSDISWCVPISSRVQKYQKTAQRRIDNQIARGIFPPRCDGIRFGSILGQPRAFLVQNMFPVTEKYVIQEYTDKNSLTPVTTTASTQRDVILKARYALRLLEKGQVNLFYADVLSIRQQLIAEAHPLVLTTERTVERPAQEKISIKNQLAASKLEADRRNSTRPLSPRDRDHGRDEKEK